MNPAGIVASLRDVTVTYDGYQTRALSHVTVEFRRGEVTGVLGGPGAGKSTAFKILAGQMAPTEGKVKVFDRSPRAGAKARVGYLPGKVDLNRPPGFVDRLLGRRRTSPPAGRGIARLAQAMLGNRDLLVLDDPFADLEPAELIEAKALIRDMVGRGKTVVLSSDSLMDVKDFCDRFVIVHEGKVQAIGTLTELLSSTSAIRFLPAVLPDETAERLLNILREEILAPSSMPGPRSAPEIDSKSVGRNESESTPQRASAASQIKSKDSIDHGKLEELTKTKKPE
jgi:ABC-2 type transport system ATP-binding protein